MKNLEKAAREYAKNEAELLDDYSSHAESFKAGHQFAIDNSSEGFDEWLKDYKIRGIGMAPYNKDVWQAAKLSCAKELAEKDEEIKFLKSCNEKLEEARVAHLETSEELEKKIEELKSDLDKIKWLIIGLKNHYDSGDNTISVCDELLKIIRKKHFSEKE